MSVNTSPDPAVAGSVFAVVLAIGSLVVSFYNVKRANEIQRDRELKNCAIDALERAYETFTNGDDSTVPPVPSRYGWLTTARRILVFQKLSKMIVSEEYRLVCREEEEHWRHKFYRMIQTPDILLPNYFEGNKEEGKVTEVEPKSIAVIFDFVQWREGKQDDLSSVNLTQMMKSGRVVRGHIGLDLFLQNSDEYQAIIENEKGE